MPKSKKVVARKNQPRKIFWKRKPFWNENIVQRVSNTSNPEVQRPSLEQASLPPAPDRYQPPPPDEFVPAPLGAEKFAKKPPPPGPEDSPRPESAKLLPAEMMCIYRTKPGFTLKPVEPCIVKYFFFFSFSFYLL